MNAGARLPGWRNRNGTWRRRERASKSRIMAGEADLRVSRYREIQDAFAGGRRRWSIAEVRRMEAVAEAKL